MDEVDRHQTSMHVDYKVSPASILARVGVPQLSGRDGAAFLGLAAVALTLLLTTPLSGSPFEDAAILLRYANNLASGYGLVWNIGEAPVDGATDFLFAVTVAGLAALGMDIEIAARLVIVLAWFATVGVVYGTARRVHATSALVALVAAIPVLVGPVRLYLAAAFGTPFFGLWVATSAALTLIVIERRSATIYQSVLVGVSFLLMGLTRPEGVLMAVLLTLGVLVALRPRPALRALRWGGVVFLVAGSIYFAWRWWYFGYPLPNPYYKKGGGEIHPDGLLDAARAGATFLMPFGLLWLAAVTVAPVRRQAAALGLPIVGFLAIWALLSSEMNYAFRFQYPVLVLVALAWPALFVALTRTPGLQSRYDRIRAATECRLGWVPKMHIPVMATVTVAGIVLTVATAPNLVIDERAQIGRILAGYPGSSPTLATTEAGLIPFESGWNALDTWGLNDPTIAHRQFVTDADLDATAPLVVFLQQAYVPGSGPVPDPYLGKAWTDMTITMNDWLGRNDYNLVRSVSGDSVVTGSTFNIWVAGRADAGIVELTRSLACDSYPGVPNIASAVLVPVSCNR